MRFSADDWTFIQPSSRGCLVAVDLFLDNGQHARLEVYPLVNPYMAGDQTPEIIVLCEMPGENLHRPPLAKRWITRPPDNSCEWSKVELSPTLIRQINEQLEAAMATEGVEGDEAA
jgi:hypothetical protein